MKIVMRYEVCRNSVMHRRCATIEEAKAYAKENGGDFSCYEVRFAKINGKMYRVDTIGRAF